MIVYIKNKSGQIYASPVFAEIGRSWGCKSVVLDETGDSFILLPYINFKNINTPSEFNYFYIDGTRQDGWVKKIGIRGFEEIIKNKKFIKSLKKGNKVPIDGFECVKLYNLPLPVITEFEIKNKRDIDKFYTVCWGLHDACTEKITKVNNDIIINFDTTWSKHIVITFSNVTDFDITVLEQDGILDSEFEICNGDIIWRVTAMAIYEDDESYKDPYIVAKSVTWKLLID